MIPFIADSQLPSFRPQISLSRLRAYVRILFHPKASIEGAGPPSHTIDVPHPANLSIPQRLPTDPTASCDLLYELAPHLRSWLPRCRWLEEGAIKFMDDRPVDVGEVANIYLGMRGNRKVVIKCYRFHPSSDYLPTHTRFRQEALACGRFRNQSFVPFIGIYSTPQHPMCLVFEYMDQSNLREYLRKNKHVGRRELLLEIARAVEYLHKIDVVHKNIKTSNILVDAGGHAHLGGLGVALLPSGMAGVNTDRFFRGAAPELVDHERFGLTNTGATTASDVYAFGVLAWETFAGEVPFSDKRKVAAVVSMWKGRRPGRPNHPELSDRLWRTIQACWKAEPGQRMAIAEVVAVFEEELAVHQSKSR